MGHDFDIIFDQCAIRKHFQEFLMLGTVTKKTQVKKIYTFYVNFHFLNIFFQFAKIILLVERLNNIE